MHGRRQHKAILSLIEVKKLFETNFAHWEVVHLELFHRIQEEDALASSPEDRLNHHLLAIELMPGLDEIVHRATPVAEEESLFRG